LVTLTDQPPSDIGVRLRTDSSAQIGRVAGLEQAIDDQGSISVSETAGTSAVTLHTTEGDIRIILFGNHAPKTVRNFEELAQGAREWTHPQTRAKTSDPLYDGTIFHRIIPGFMIQGGDPLGQGFGGPGYQFADEFHPDLRFDRPYLLAMANSGPGTNGSQFFITVGPTPHLNRKHTIFGEVADAESRAVVDAIAGTKTGANDRPIDDIAITSVTVEPAGS
jgi:peptidyl-prolyl cis-trans isomerase A (cyclophilin A)